jgi:hypothetical protein
VNYLQVLPLGLQNSGVIADCRFGIFSHWHYMVDARKNVLVSEMCDKGLLKQ